MAYRQDESGWPEYWLAIDQTVGAYYTNAPDCFYTFLSFPVAAARTTANPSSTEWVSLGGTSARALIYRTYSLETPNNAITRAYQCARRYAPDATPITISVTLPQAFLAGALDNTVVIAPRMASSAVNRYDYPCE